MTSGIPAMEKERFHEKRAPYALIIGVYNEGEKFTRQLGEIQPCRGLVDVIIADGASTDGATSPEALEGKVRTLLINRDAQRGLSVQYRGALNEALEEGYEGVIMADGNGKDGMDAIARFVEKLREGYDFVQGSRFMPGGEHANTPLDRVLGIRMVFNPIINFGSPFKYTDGMNGYKACSRRFLLDERVQPFRPEFVRYSLQYFLNYIAPRIGAKVAEIPVARRYPKDGGPYSKIGGLRGRVKIMGELLSTIAGRYDV